MENDNLKAKAEEQDKHLVRILPVETDRTHKDKDGKERLMQRQWTSDKSGRFFPANLSAEQFKQILAKTRVKIENLLLKVEGDFIVYRYKGRPLIRLNLRDGQFYSPASVVEEYGKNLFNNKHILF